MQVVCPHCLTTFHTELISATDSNDHSPICCIDCGVIICKYEHYHENEIEGWGYRDTVERTSSFDSLRCGKCCQKLLKEGWK